MLCPPSGALSAPVRIDYIRETDWPWQRLRVAQQHQSPVGPGRVVKQTRRRVTVGIDEGVFIVMLPGCIDILYGAAGHDLAEERAGIGQHLRWWHFALKREAEAGTSRAYWSPLPDPEPIEKRGWTDSIHDTVWRYRRH